MSEWSGEGMARGAVEALVALSVLLGDWVNDVSRAAGYNSSGAGDFADGMNGSQYYRRRKWRRKPSRRTPSQSRTCKSLTNFIYRSQRPLM